MAIVVFLHNSEVLRKMTPNEWGDFFGGIFAPLAFLWLVLGYLQQGEELRLSTKALNLQAEELKHSVEQQRELVEVTRQQVESDREALKLEFLARQEAAKPVFVIKNAGGSFSPGQASYGISVNNAGNTVTEVLGYLEGLGDDKIMLFDVGMFARLGQIQAKINLTPPFPETGLRLSITYIDALGQSGYNTFNVTKQRDDLGSPLGFHQTAG